MDNTVAVTYINKMGGKIATLNALSKTFWEFCMTRDIFISACHLPGAINLEADYLSRHFNSHTEWMLDKGIFGIISNLYGTCDIDLFASKYNYQISTYVSYTPDKQAKAVDAFTISWNHLKCFIFCPFSIIGKVLQKIVAEKVEAVVVAPIWPTQPWFPQLLQLVSETSYILPNKQKLLHLPNDPEKIHPIPKMRLGVFRVSGNRSRVDDYQMTLSRYSFPRGENQLKNNIGHITKNGCDFVTKGKLMCLIPM